MLALVGLVHVAEFYHDDAYITLRYASRLLAGEGLNWNPGERVEGFTDPLWLGQIAALGAAGIDLATASRLLGLAYLAALVPLWWRARAAPLLLLLVGDPAGPVAVVGRWPGDRLLQLLVGARRLADPGGAVGRPRRRPGRAACGARRCGAGRGGVDAPGGDSERASSPSRCSLPARRGRATAAAAAAFAALAGSYQVFRVGLFRRVVPQHRLREDQRRESVGDRAGGFRYLADTSTCGCRAPPLRRSRWRWRGVVAPSPCCASRRRCWWRC
jgi:hypothetical protein